MSVSARSPEELETLFEDALTIRDSETLSTLFEAGAVLAVEAQTAQGREESARLALATWEHERSYVADPCRIVQGRDIALVVVERGINVVRRRSDGTWLYAIIIQFAENGTEEGKQ